jgi:branched-chain amino acid transport system permease protein
VTQVLLSGLASGAVYGLVGMGFAVGFYVTRVINFAEGQLLMIAVMVAAAIARTGAWTGFALAGGLAAAVLAGVGTYFVAVRPVLAFSRFSFAWLVSTLGVALILQNVAAILWGPTSRSFPTLLNGTGVHIGSATLTVQELVTIGVAIGVAAAFELVRKRTLFGKAGMAIAYDPEMASALGANTGLMAVIAFAGAGLFAGIAGILVGPITYSNPYLGDTYGIAGFVALMIGGTERPVGAMVGGLILGILEEGSKSLINTQASDWFPFVVVVAILLLMPQGLFSIGPQSRGLSRLWRKPRAAVS